MNNRLPNPHGTPVTIETNRGSSYHRHVEHLGRMTIIPRRKDVIYHNGNGFFVTRVGWSNVNGEWEVTLYCDVE